MMCQRRPVDDTERGRGNLGMDGFSAAAILARKATRRRTAVTGSRAERKLFEVRATAASLFWRSRRSVKPGQTRREL